MRVLLENNQSTSLHFGPETQVIYQQFVDNIIHHEKHQRQLSGPARLAIQLILAAALTATGVGASFASALGFAEGTAGFAAASAFGASAATSITQQAIINGTENGFDGLKMTFRGKNLLKVLENATLAAATAGVTEKVAKQFNLQGAQAESIDKFKKAIINTTVTATIDTAFRGGKFLHNLRDVSKENLINFAAAEAAGVIGDLKYEQGLDPFTHKVLHAIVGGLAAEFSGSDFASGALGAVVAETVAELYLEAAKSNLEDDNTPFLKECADEIAEYKAEHGGRPLTGLEVNACCKAVAQRLVDRAGLTGKIGAIATAFASNHDVAGANNAAVNAIDNNFVMLLATPQGIALLGTIAGGMMYAGTQIYNSYKASVGDDATSQALFDAFAADPDAAKGVLEGFDPPSNNDDDNDEAYLADENAGKAKVSSTPVDEDAGKFKILGIPLPDLQLAKTIAILAMSYLELNPLSSILMNKAEGAAKQRGVNNPKTRRALDFGNAKDKEFKKNTKCWDQNSHNPKHKPDLETESMVHELKPGSVSGVKKGLKQLQRYQNVFEKPGLLHLYEPEDSKIDLDEIAKKCFPDHPVVKEVNKKLPD